MEPATLSALAVAVVGALAAIGSWLDSRSRARRARDRATITAQDQTIANMTQWGDLALEHIYRVLSGKRAHNAAEHPDTAGEIPIFPVPERLARGIRAEVEESADD